MLSGEQMSRLTLALTAAHSIDRIDHFNAVQGHSDTHTHTCLYLSLSHLIIRGARILAGLFSH